jgi:hypothetical protein
MCHFFCTRPLARGLSPIVSEFMPHFHPTAAFSRSSAPRQFDAYKIDQAADGSYCGARAPRLRRW